MPPTLPPHCRQGTTPHKLQGLSWRRDNAVLRDASIDSLDANLHFPNNLSLSNCPRLVTLPAGLKVDGDLVIRNCRRLRSLGTDWWVGGSLEIENCPEITALPAQLPMGQRKDPASCVLAARSCSQLHEVGEQPGFCGRLVLERCPNLYRLPSNFGNLQSGSVILRNLQNLTTLPAGLFSAPQQQGELDVSVSSCPRLRVLPQLLYSRGDLTLQNCQGLRRISRRIHVPGRLLLRDCARLAMGAQLSLEVDQDVRVENCPQLEYLGRRWRWGRDLHLINCRQLHTLALDSSALGEGDVAIVDCPALSTLPVGLFEHAEVWAAQGPRRSLLLEGCRIDSEAMSRYVALAAPNFAVTTSRNGLALCPPAMSDLKREVLWWLSVYDGPKRRASQQPLFLTSETGGHFDPQQQDVLLSFLRRLRDTAGFKNVDTRAALAQAILHWLRHLWSDAALRCEMVERLEGARPTCEDGDSLAFNDLYLDTEVAACARSHSRLRLEQMGEGVLMYKVVQDAAERKVSAILAEKPDFTEDVEVHLAYQVALAQKLRLPIPMRNMLHGSALLGYDVTKAEIAAAAAAARRAVADPAHRTSFFASWTPWQRQLRQEQADALRFEALPPHIATAGLRARLCCISQEDFGLRRPKVAWRPWPSSGEWEFCYLSDLLAWWVTHGTDPLTLEPLFFSALRRVEDLAFWRRRG